MPAGKNDNSVQRRDNNGNFIAIYEYDYLLTKQFFRSKLACLPTTLRERGNTVSKKSGKVDETAV